MTVPGRNCGKSITEGNPISFGSFLIASKHLMTLGVLGRRCGIATRDCGDTELETIESFARLKRSSSLY